MDYAQEQADELEALSSIFADDLEGGKRALRCAGQCDSALPPPVAAGPVTAATLTPRHNPALLQK